MSISRRVTGKRGDDSVGMMNITKSLVTLLHPLWLPLRTTLRKGKRIDETEIRGFKTNGTRL
ncbi:MAG: hypothetical protein MK179_09255 [Pirellulaceae bacterium]|nr:hypothetical protein [Pirellulaceae bacterium]